MNLVLALLLVGGSGAALWSGITDPEKGLWGGIADLMAGRDVRSRAEAGLTRPSMFDTIAGGALGLAAPVTGGVNTGVGQAATGVRGAVLTDARTWLGVPYKWGGTTRAGADCSGFLQTLFRGHGVSLPRVSYMQAMQGEKRTAATARPGDIVAFGVPVSHVGLVIGPGQMIHAPRTGRDVSVEAIAGVAKSKGSVYYRDVLGSRR